MGLNVWQLLLVLLIVLLLFGRGRIPAIMGDLAAGIKSFKHGVKEDNTDISNTSNQKKVDTTGAVSGEQEHV